MADNKLLLIGLVGIGAYFLLNKKGVPTYYDMQGHPVNLVPCGESVSFDVPGYSVVWLSQLKNGQLNYDGLFPLPMSPRVLTCGMDVGIYDVAVFDVDTNGQKSNLIGQTRLTVSPA